MIRWSLALLGVARHALTSVFLSSYSDFHASFDTAPKGITCDAPPISVISHYEIIYTLKAVSQEAAQSGFSFFAKSCDIFWPINFLIVNNSHST